MRPKPAPRGWGKSPLPLGASFAIILFRFPCKSHPKPAPEILPNVFTTGGYRTYVMDEPGAQFVNKASGLAYRAPGLRILLPGPSGKAFKGGPIEMDSKPAPISRGLDPGLSGHVSGAFSKGSRSKTFQKTGSGSHIHRPHAL